MLLLTNISRGVARGDELTSEAEGLPPVSLRGEFAKNTLATRFDRDRQGTSLPGRREHWPGIGRTGEESANGNCEAPISAAGRGAVIMRLAETRDDRGRNVQ